MRSQVSTLNGFSPTLGFLSFVLFLCGVATNAAVNYGGEVPLGSKLMHVSVLYRHGDRNPKSPYPKSEFKDLKHWEGNHWGELTTTGIQQHEKLGRALKALYGPDKLGLLPREYNVKVFRVVSTDVDRTIMSAMANNAGLWRPLPGHGIHEPEVQWIPVPVRVIADNKYDTIFGQNCSRADMLVDSFRNERFERLKNENLLLFEYAKKKSGYDVINHPIWINWLYDTLTVEKLRKGKIPPWADKPFLDHLLSFIMEYYKSGSLTEEVRRLTGGPILKTIINTMKNVTEGKDSVKMFVLSAHETSIYDVLAALCTPPNKPPGYTAAIFFELYATIVSGGELDNYFIRVFYRPGPEQVAVPVKIPGCGEKYTCSFKKFIEITQHVLPDDLNAECAL